MNNKPILQEHECEATPDKKAEVCDNEPQSERVITKPPLKKRVTIAEDKNQHHVLDDHSSRKVFQAVFLYCYPHCPSCLAHVNSIDWATWPILAAV